MPVYSNECYKSETANSLVLKKPTLLAETLQKTRELYAGIPGNWLNKESIEEFIREGDVDEEMLNQVRESALCFNHEYLRVPAYEKRRGLFFLLQTLSGLGRVISLYGAPLFLIICLGFGYLSYHMGDEFWFGVIRMTKIFLFSILLPCFIVDWGIKAILHYFGQQLFGGFTTEYEFCRVSGQVKVFEPETGTLKHCFPFSECVAETWAQVGHQGIVIRHPLLLRHYSNPVIKIDGGRLGADRTLIDTYVTWDFIQRYMDVTSPLPDIPILEYWRRQDATTRRFDERSGRNPRYWRELTKDQIEDVLSQQDKLNEAVYRARLNQLNVAK
ncbi:hypothetical protein [Motilimonas sp. KMU-193]|uniref:hypothetical protein n=1 Tax=Motilimonas sp. KMU-193 TaxID=3388668 RepID=UPI00396B2AA6